MEGIDWFDGDYDFSVGIAEDGEGDNIYISQHYNDDYVLFYIKTYQIDSLIEKLSIAKMKVENDE
jgi:hypothetical protein